MKEISCCKTWTMQKVWDYWCVVPTQKFAIQTGEREPENCHIASASHCYAILKDINPGLFLACSVGHICKIAIVISFTWDEHVMHISN
jgi:hypothetical protein